MTNMIKFTISLLLAFFSNRLAAGQFMNLDFESADLSGSQIEFRRSPGVGPPPDLGRYPFGTGTPEKLLPGWQVYFGDTLTNAVAIGNGFFGAVMAFDGPNHAALLIPGDNFFGGDLVFPLGRPDGNYALLLDNTYNSFFGQQPRMTVRQTGDVPAEATWLTFRQLNEAEFFLRIDGQSFPTRTFISDPNDRARLWFDISPWAGKTITLGFQGSFGGHDAIDSIAFIVPEPGTMALIVLGAASLLARAFFLRKRR